MLKPLAMIANFDPIPAIAPMAFSTSLLPFPAFLPASPSCSMPVLASLKLDTRRLIASMGWRMASPIVMPAFFAVSPTAFADPAALSIDPPTAFTLPPTCLAAWSAA